ncbi:MAG: hypothetical protein Kow0029_30940 [Candidatus Rifleibacteriota bacterium]
MLYHNFITTGIYDPKGDAGSSTAIEELARQINDFIVIDKERLSEINETDRIFLKEYIAEGSIRPEELYFYFENKNNYALFLTGSFCIDESNFKERFFTRTNEGIEFKLESARIKSIASSTLHLENNLVLVCPAVRMSEYLEKIRSRKCLLIQKFRAFKKMLPARPGLAVEIDMDLLNKALKGSGMRTPPEFDFIKHLRLIVDNRMAKIQFYIPDEEQRAVFSKTLNENLGFFDELTGGNASFSLTIKGSSIYLETEAMPELERKISQKFAALLLHFLQKAEMRREFVSAEKTNNESKN